MKLEDFLARLSFVLSFISIFLCFITGYLFAEENLKIEIEGLESINKEEFLYLLGINENKNIDKETISKGIKRVFFKDIFDDIIVEKKENVIKIIVKEKATIKSIEIIGNKYLSESFFKNLLTFKKGQKIKYSEINKYEKELHQAITKKGFINSEIKIHPICNNTDCDIKILIKEGQPSIIKEIKWQGEKDEYIKNLLTLKVGNSFDEMLMNDFIEKTKKYYEKQGRVGSAVSYSFENFILTIKLIKGKILELDILGAEYLNKKDLLNILKTYFKDKINDNIIKDSVNSLISFYKINGFIDVKIQPLIEIIDDYYRITYIISEGKRKFVERVEMNIKNDDINIKKILINKEGSPFNPEELESDRERIENYLKNKGYYYAKVYPGEIKEEDENIKIYFNVDTGQKIKIKSINFEVKDDILKDESLNILKNFESETFNESVFLEIKRKIREFYLKNGYSDTVIEGKYEIKNNEAYIYLSINPGTKKYFGKSIILGNRKTKTKFIYNRLLPKEEKPYNPYLIEEERQTLYRTGLFSRLEIIPQTDENGKIDLIYDLEEAPAGAFEFGLGYGEYERAKGFMELSYINLFGMNKQIFSRIELSNIEQRTYITYIDPWFWKDLTFKSSLNFERISSKNIDTKEIIYKLKRYGFSAGFEKKFLNYFKGEILYEATYSKTWDVMPEVIISDIDIGEIFISGIKASLIYDSRDNPFDPKKGWLAGVTTKISSDFLGSEINFMKTSFYINKYTELINGLVMATSLRGGWAWIYGDTKDLPISERYFLGGRDTVRGYAQNTLGSKKNNQPTGGNAFLMGNIEFRISLGKNFFIVNFLDFGNVWTRVGDVDPSNLKYTTGIGLRYKTPVGPLRIDYGYKLNKEKGESNGEIHFSIGHAF